MKQRGFTLLFAVFVSTLVLSVGASIIAIALKQILFSGAGRESQFAFYAADTGVECALYWDFNSIDALGITVFATSSESSDIGAVAPVPDVDCTGGNIIDGSGRDTVLPAGYVWTIDAPNPTEATTTFSIAIEDSTVNPPIYYCADVQVGKYYNSSLSRIVTTIDSRGYNTCDKTTPDIRRFERGLRVRY